MPTSPSDDPIPAPIRCECGGIRVATHDETWTCVSCGNRVPVKPAAFRWTPAQLAFFDPPKEKTNACER